MRRVLRPTTAIPMARNAETTSQRKAIHPQGPLRSAFTSSVLPIPPYVPAGRSGRVPDTANHGRTNRLPSSTAAPATSNARPPAEIALIPAMARTRGIASNTFRYKCPRGRIHTAVTYINASKTCSGCPGTAIFLRASSDGGATWGAAQPVSLARGRGWQFDPQIQVATDGTVYVVFLQTFDPGSVLFKSTDHGATWSGPFTLNGALSYNDKPIILISPSGQDVYVAFNVKLASYVAVSHDPGRTLAQVPTSNESLWWYAYGGTYAPDGNVYFAQAGEAGAKTNGKRTNQGHTDGIQKIFVLKMNHGGTAWENVYIDTSMVSTPCAIPGCYGDYFAAQAAVAADASGHLLFAYTRNDVNGTAHRMYIRSSPDGVSWSDPKLVNDRGDSNFPAIVAGPTAGDFRLAWQDNRYATCWDCGGLGSWNTWYAQTTDGGGTWTASVRLSNLRSGAPYKTSQGYAFPDGDYFGLTVDSAGGDYR